MRKRIRNRTGDSFDLFLDTITNTFGGVLLITLLIVLLIKDNTQSADRDFEAGSQEDAQIVESQIQALEAEKNSLAANLQVQQNLIRDLQNEDTAELVQQLSDQLEEINQLEAAAAQLSLQTKSIAASKQGLEAQQQDLAENLAKKTAEFERLSKQLQSQMALRTRTMALPKETTTTKTEIPLVVKNNQIYVINKNRGGRTFAFNTDHFQVAQANQADLNFENQYLQAIPGKGIEIGSNAWIQEMRQYSESRVFFTFVVRSNSFGKFHEVRDSCVNQGFEYRILPTDDVVGQGSSASVKTQ